MIAKEERHEAKPKGWLWHYLGIEKLSALVRGVTSEHYSDFYCWNCLHSFRAKSKLAWYKSISKYKGFCHVIMPSEDTKILEVNMKNLIKHHLLFMQI